MRKLGLMSEDVELLDRFKASNCFGQVMRLDLQNTGTASVDVLVGSDRCITPEVFASAVRQSGAEEAFYMVSKDNFTNLSEALLGSKGIKMIPPSLTAEEICIKITRQISKQRTSRSNIFTFVGADAKVGTSMVSTSIAKRLARESDRVLYLSLDGSFGDDYVHFESKYGLDDIKTKLQTRIMSAKELQDITLRTDSGFCVFPGVKCLLNVNQYHPDQIEYLLESLSEIFEVVIIDAGSRMDLGMTIAALNITQNRFLVTTQQHSALHSFRKVHDQIMKKLHIEGFLLIVNKFVETSELEGVRAISAQYGCAYAASLPYMEYGWQCEKEHITLLEFGNKGFADGIDQIAGVIRSHLGMASEPMDGINAHGFVGKWLLRINRKKSIKKEVIY